MFTHEIRCAYWINANNPISATQGSIYTTNTATGVVTKAPYYTQSVGYVGTDGTIMPVTSSGFTHPSSLIVAVDGVYGGRQKVLRKGQLTTPA